MKDILAFDCETTGLSPFYDHVVLAQYRWNDDPVVVTRAVGQSQLHELLDSADLIIGHNLAFDFGMINYIPKSVDHWDDTMLLSRIQDFRAESHSLDAVIRRHLGYDPFEQMDKKKMQKSNWAGDLSLKQIAYAEMDVEFLLAIYEDFKRTVKHPIYRFDKKSTMDGLKIQRHGLPILHDDVKMELVKQLEIYENACDELPFNPLSPKQVTAHMKIPSSGDRVLAELVSRGNEVAGHIRTARSARKYSGFLGKLLKHERFYGTLGPRARSGRFTSDKENIQNLPRDTKRFIGSADKLIISADYAQLELRTIACIARDETMIELFRAGKDLHDYAAISLYGEDFTPQQRQIAKVFNFSLLYGAGAATVRDILIQQTGIDMPEDEVQRRKRKWKETFYGVKRWQEQGAYRHQNLMPYQTPAGRPYTSKRYTDHLSIENQGAGAEVARIALHLIGQRLTKGASLINFIHDSYVVESVNRPAVYQSAARVIHKAMTESWERAPFEKYGVPMPVEVGVAHNLKDADSLKNCIYIYDGDVI